MLQLNLQMGCILFAYLWRSLRTSDKNNCLLYLHFYHSIISAYLQFNRSIGNNFRRNFYRCHNKIGEITSRSADNLEIGTHTHTHPSSQEKKNDFRATIKFHMILSTSTIFQMNPLYSRRNLFVLLLQ